MAALTQEQAIERLSEMRDAVFKDDAELLSGIIDLLGEVGWCDVHGRPLTPLDKAPCVECIDAQDTMTKFEAEHGPDQD